jgi:molecular chaperone DnaJ
MAKRDYYEVLGVAKNATEPEIKNAYRSLARRYHPDVNPNNKEAEERFKEVSEAYQVLIDPEKRTAYDQFGHDGPGGQGFGGFEGGVGDMGDIGSIFGDFINDFLGGGRQRSGPRRGSDLRYDLEISFEEAVFGCEKVIELRKAAACTKCKGTGAAPGTGTKVCPVCKGRGQISFSQGFFSIQKPCHNCQGAGEIIEKPCTECHGSSRIQQSQRLEVRIPAGVETGSKLKLTGEGEPGDRGGPGGNLYVIIFVRKHDFFERVGDDVVCEVVISFPRAALGGEIEVPTLRTPVKIKIPAGTQTGKVFRLRGYGVKSLRGTEGDQLVKVVVRTPTQLNSKQRELLEAFAKECPEETVTGDSASSKSFFDKVKEALGGGG